MGVKDFWAKTGNWLRAHKPSRHRDYQPQINDQGLISHDSPSTPASGECSPEPAEASGQVIVKKATTADKNQSLERMETAFGKLVDQLGGINEHLSRQAAQHEDLMSRIDKMPKFLESFPAVVENQKKVSETLLEQLKATGIKDQQFIEAVEKIPLETGKQTDVLVDIDHQLSAVADINAQMAENFNKFNDTLSNLNQSTAGQTDSIMQMSKTFATSDRYLKYIMSRQSKRFMWLFITTVVVCMLAILILTGIIIYLSS